MAKKVKPTPTATGHCRDCIHHYDEHERNVKGEFFMARCKFQEWAVFLNSGWCEHFQR